MFTIKTSWIVISVIALAFMGILWIASKRGK